MVKKKSAKKLSTKQKINSLFRHLAEYTAHFMGTPIVFFIAVLLIIAWAILGFYYEFSDTWQLLINTATTIGTFLMVILIQNTQTRESKSIQLKLDELIFGTKRTRNTFVELEEQTDEEIDMLKNEFKIAREKYIRHLENDLQNRRKRAKAKRKR